MFPFGVFPSLENLLSVCFYVPLSLSEVLFAPMKFFLDSYLVNFEIRVLFERDFIESRACFAQRILKKVNLKFETEIFLLDLGDDLAPILVIE